ncbi:MAG: hypothetical protein OEW75_08870 [Cyclobacteriaceae bacterium]|nr:hypothetical protein [Cyclobacteriaceae bacterium]
MDIRENPNYYIQERPYKSKYICCKCRKAFKRKVPLDVKGLNEEKEPSKCSDCGNETTWIGPKFRPPKSTDIKIWNSIDVLSRIGLLNFTGFVNNKIEIPESPKSLKILLEEIKNNFEWNIKKWMSADYAEGNSEQIRIFSELIQKIEKELKTSS